MVLPDLQLALTEHVLIKRQSLGFAINPDALAILANQMNQSAGIKSR